MSARSRRPFVLLDRDGTLVRDAGYVHRVADYALLPGAVEGLRALREAGFALAIITNQSGIGRGRFSVADFEAFQRHLVADLARHGVVIEGSFHCPHLPDAGCDCRKPAPGLLWRARDELGARLDRSWVIGDAENDVRAARNAGCAGAIRIAAAGTDRPTGEESVARDLVEAARLICAAASVSQT